MKRSFLRVDTRTGKVVVVLLVLLCDVIIWSVVASSYLKEPEQLRDIAYDVNKRHGYTIYIEEEMGYQPYLVLTRNYDNSGDVLLLRQFVLDEYKSFSNGEGYSVLYDESYIDNYLNTEYFQMLSSDTQDRVINSFITVSGGASNVKKIRRKAFLLSYIELSAGSPRGRAADGKPLRYFKYKSDQVVATDESGTSVPYMLRSSGGARAMIMVINADGQARARFDREAMGVRPAFCLSGDLEIVEDDTIVAGQSVYVLKEDYP